MKKVMMTVFKIVLILIAVVVVGVVALILFALHKESNYYKYTEAVGEIEQKYTAFGDKEVSCQEYDANDDVIGKYAVWYPSELESSNTQYPVVIFANGTGSTLSTYKPFLTHLSSWGFISVGNDDENTRTGASLEETIKFLIAENEKKDSIFYHKIDLDNIGIAGHSQGGPAVFNMVTNQEHGSMVKALYAASATSSYGWGSSTIVNILKKREYLGHTINFKTRKHFKDKKSHYVDESEWTIFENAHEAIIDQETFDNVQRIRANVRRYPDGWGEAHPLTGLMYCADCGGKMYVHRVNNGKRDPQFTCSQYSKIPCGTLCGTQHRIRAEAVLTLITDMLRVIAEYSQNDRAEFIRTVQETQVTQQTADISKKRKRLAAAQKRAGELEKLICKIYEDNALGKLPDARYEALDAQYAKEQDALNAEITELEKAVTGYEQSRKSAEKFIALIDKYENFDTLTNTMLNEFVEKILVHERARKGSQDTTQEVEIYFNFVGRYIPPALQPVPLTPEEQEELRKKSANKKSIGK